MGPCSKAYAKRATVMATPPTVTRSEGSVRYAGRCPTFIPTPRLLHSSLVSYGGQYLLVS